MPRTPPSPFPKKDKKPSRRARGTGALFWNKRRQVWVGRVVVGRKQNGDPLYVERSDPLQAEVVKKLAKATPPSTEVTLTEFARWWLSDMQCRPNTRESRTNSIERHILPHLGGLRLGDILPQHIERTVAAWLVGKMSANTARLVVGHLQTCLKEAVRAGLRADNPAALARKPRATKKIQNLFDPKEVVRVIKHASERPATRSIALIAACGLRSGEAFALDVEDFDPMRHTIQITKTFGWHGIGPAKSIHSIRTIEVPDGAIPAVVAAIGERTTGPLFASRTGQRYTLNSMRDAWDQLLARLKLAPRNPHVLRHSVATNLNAIAMPTGDAAKYIGDSIMTYVSTYLHATGADVCGALNRLYDASA